MRAWYRSGFTLVEILVVITIISILAGAGFMYAQQTSERSRDSKRQADLKLLQAAIESYKQENGVYPESCNMPTNANQPLQWSGELNTANECPSGSIQYIVGLAPTYIPTLPRDPRRGDCVANDDCGFMYVTNFDRSVYKVMVANTIESDDNVTYAHPMKSCDSTAINDGNIAVSGWCSRTLQGNNNLAITSSDVCHQDNTRFQRSYGVWGGIAPLITTDLAARFMVGSTEVCVDIWGVTGNPLNDFLYCNTRGVITTPPTPVGQWNSRRNLARLRVLEDTLEVICK